MIPIPRDFVDCLLCGKQNWIVLPEVKEGEPYKEGHCQHLIWIPYIYWYSRQWGRDFKDFLKIRVPQFHALNMDVVPSEALDANRETLEKVLQKNHLQKRDDCWFSTDKELQDACKELATFLKPLCDFCSQPRGRGKV